MNESKNIGKMTMQKPFFELWAESCELRHFKLAFPEAYDDRILAAAMQLCTYPRLSEIQLFGDEKEVRSRLDLAFPNWMQTSQGKLRLPSHSAMAAWDKEVRMLFDAEAARGKAVPDPQELAYKRRHALYQAGMMLRAGAVDAVIAGAVETTGEVIRAALKTVGLSEGTKRMSGAFVMERRNGSAGSERYLFADCAVNIAPSSEELCAIARETARLHEAIDRSEPPRLAFLSFSTHGSAKSPEQAKVQAAASRFAAEFPEILSDGELQADAALVPDVARRKCPTSPLAGRANCLIFPDLNTGNIAYKLTERLGGFHAYGPILLGLKRPYCDLSRGATPQDIVATALICLMRADKLASTGD